MEIAILCCNLLQRVARDMNRQPSFRNTVSLLCRIAFRHSIPGRETWVDPLDIRTLGRFPTLIREGVGEGGEEFQEFIRGLVSFFGSATWSEEPERHILGAFLEIPASGLSQASRADIITVLGRARWLVVAGLDHGRLTDLVGRLQADMDVDRVVSDESVCIGWMRLLLFFTFRPPRAADTRPLWRIILSALHQAPQFFSHDLLRYLDPSKALSYSNDRQSKIPWKEEEALWMILFWSSRFF